MLSDIYFAFRQLAKAPGFCAIIVLTLALGIGANTAIFSFFNGILMRPLAFREPEQLALLQQRALKFGDVSFSPADFADMMLQSKTLESAATFTTEVASLTGRGPAGSLFCAVVSGDFFSVLGSTAIVGRTFSQEEIKPGAQRVALVSHRLWQAQLGGDTRALGQTLTLNGVPCTVIGVMPADFEFPRWIDAWVNPAGAVPESILDANAADPSDRNNYYLSAVGRIAPGQTFHSVEQELSTFVNKLPAPSGQPNFERSVRLQGLRDHTVGSVRPALRLLLGCVGLVLLIACLNIANLLLSRANLRQREIGIRVALGASRARIIRQLLTESVVLSALGGVAGLLVAQWLSQLLLTIAPADLPRLANVRLDSSVLVFATLVSLFTGVLFGLAPALPASSPNMTRFLKEGERAATAGSGRRRLRALLVSSEVSLALVLLITAGLLTKSFWQMSRVDWGIVPDHVISLRVACSGPKYNDEGQRLAFYRSVLDGVRGLPGVEQACASMDQFSQSWSHGIFRPHDQPFASPEDMPHANFHIVSPGFFSTLHIPLHNGRDFTVADDERAPKIAIISDAVARRFFPNGDAVGNFLHFGFGEASDARTIQIVGVVGDIKFDGPEANPAYEIYIPYPQNAYPSFFLNIRTPLSATATAAAVKKVVQGIDGTVPVVGESTMKSIIAWPTIKRRFPLVLISIFAGLALLLAVIGIYSVVAYNVANRTREIGIRMALGALPQSIIRLVLSQSMKSVLVGIAVGLGAGAAVAFLVRGLLFGTQPFDLTTFVLVPLLLALAATLACWLPARRATRVNPMEALRAE